MRACILFHGKGIVHDNAFVCRAKPYIAMTDDALVAVNGRVGRCVGAVKVIGIGSV